MPLSRFGRTARRALRRPSAGRYSGGRAAARRRDRKTLAILVLILLAGLAAVTLIRLRPVLKQMAVHIVDGEITRLVNDAINDRISDGSLDYDDLVTLDKASDGTITALTTNMARINALQTEITNCVLDRLSETLTTTIKVPLGNIIGGTLLSGHGPGIPVRVVSITDVTPRFSNEFTAAGINQTRHRIILEITVETELMIPGGSVSDTVRIEMIAAETIIVGAVPDAYADMGGAIN